MPTVRGFAVNKDWREQREVTSTFEALALYSVLLGSPVGRGKLIDLLRG